MRAAICLLIALLHGLLAAAFTSIALDAESPTHVSLGFGSVAMAMWFATALLAACLFIQLSKLAITTFRAWCITFPALYFFGSMDSGRISGQELLLGIFVAVLSWATWRIFLWAKLPRKVAEHASATGA
jgi:hypothetical protein